MSADEALRKTAVTTVDQRLRSWTIDWNGAPMVDGEPPRDGLHCRDLRDGADEIVRLRDQLTKANRRVAALELIIREDLRPIDCSDALNIMLVEEIHRRGGIIE